jgi:hypothetical protein
MTAPAPAQRSLGAILREHLDSEIAILRAWITTAEAKQAALVANDVVALRAVLAREEPQAEEAGRLRQVRERLAVGLAERLGVTRTPTLKAIIVRMGADGAGCEERRRDLIALSLRLQAHNERAQLLLRTGLELLDGVLGVVAGTPRVPSAYGRRGPASGRTGGGLIDLKG